MPENGTPLKLTVLTTADEFHRLLAVRLENDLAGFGQEETTEFLPQTDTSEPWPDGLRFGLWLLRRSLLRGRNLVVA